MFGLDFQTSTLAMRRSGGAGLLPALPSLRAWYDPSDLTRLFQDDAATIPVDADGDPVGAIHDKSGNGYHLTQANSTARPIYKTDGTRHWLETQGTSRNLFADTRLGLAADPNIIVSAALRPLSNLSVWNGVFGLGTGHGSLNGAFGTGGLSWRHINGATVFGSMALGTDAVVSWERSAGDRYMDGRAYVDGVQRAAAGTNTLNASNTAEKFSLMASDNNSADFLLYGLVVLGSDTTADRSVAETWLASL